MLNHKQKGIKIFLNTMVVLLFGFVQIGYAQDLVALRKATYEKSVPKQVVETFKNRYPNVLVKGWFVTHLTYWQNDYSSDWYTGWYVKRTIVVSNYELPTYFEVEFVNLPGELSRAIYNKYGFWYETRTKIHGLPIAILDYLKTSEFKTWAISTMKERIESPSWPMDIYRFQVSKGNKADILRMDIDGNLIQIRKLNE